MLSQDNIKSIVKHVNGHYIVHYKNGSMRHVYDVREAVYVEDTTGFGEVFGKEFG
jgi:hypothetical protein